MNYSLDKEPKLFGVWNYILKDKKRHYVYIVYLHTLDKKIDFSPPNEKVRVFWFPKKDIKSMNLIPEMKEMFLRSFDFKAKG